MLRAYILGFLKYGPVSLSYLNQEMFSSVNLHNNGSVNHVSGQISAVVITIFVSVYSLNLCCFPNQDSSSSMQMKGPPAFHLSEFVPWKCAWGTLPGGRTSM